MPLANTLHVTIIQTTVWKQLGESYITQDGGMAIPCNQSIDDWPYKDYEGGAYCEPEVKC